MYILLFTLEIVKEIFKNEILWKPNSVNLKGKIRLQHSNNIEGGIAPLPPPLYTTCNNIEGGITPLPSPLVYTLEAINIMLNFKRILFCL